jgi:4a-hydroxytetrahydrobiopterin dehydratase
VPHSPKCAVAHRNQRTIAPNHLKRENPGCANLAGMSDAGTSDDKTPLRGQEIHDAGLEGWRKVLNRLVVRFETGDFSTGAALVTAIAAAADEANHHPDVDLRYPHLTVSLRSHDVDAITRRDLRLARRISELAAEAGVSASAHAPDVLELALDTPDHERVKPFYRALLGYEEHAGDDLLDAAERTPSLWFQGTDSDAPDRQRWHLDVSVPHDVAQERIRAAVDAGGRVVDDTRAPAFWVLEDPDGNRSCICTWQARD